MPEGRYYGRLDRDSFRSVLTRTGDIQCLHQVYRGWGILPAPLQVLERELILYKGWDWFNYKVVGKILEQSLDNSTMLAEISFEQPCGSFYTYQAKLVKDETKTQQLKSSCNATRELVVTKYAVGSFWITSSKVMSYST